MLKHVALDYRKGQLVAVGDLSSNAGRESAGVATGPKRGPERSGPSGRSDAASCTSRKVVCKPGEGEQVNEDPAKRNP